MDRSILISVPYAICYCDNRFTLGIRMEITGFSMSRGQVLRLYEDTYKTEIIEKISEETIKSSMQATLIVIWYRRSKATPLHQPLPVPRSPEHYPAHLSPENLPTNLNRKNKAQDPNHQSTIQETYAADRSPRALRCIHNSAKTENTIDVRGERRGRTSVAKLEGLVPSSAGGDQKVRGYRRKGSIDEKFEIGGWL